MGGLDWSSGLERVMGAAMRAFVRWWTGRCEFSLIVDLAQVGARPIRKIDCSTTRFHHRQNTIRNLVSSYAPELSKGNPVITRLSINSFLCWTALCMLGCVASLMVFTGTDGADAQWATLLCGAGVIALAAALPHMGHVSKLIRTSIYARLSARLVARRPLAVSVNLAVCSLLALAVVVAVCSGFVSGNRTTAFALQLLGMTRHDH